jgi:PAS domain S-box-containing protein
MGEHQPKLELGARISHGFARLRSSALLPYIVLAVSLTTTGVWWYVLHVQATESARAEFENEAQQSVGDIREELLGFEEVLQAGAGLLLASDSVSRDEWRSFVDRLGLPRAYPGIQEVNYAERLQADQIAPLEARMRAQGNADFHVWPAGAREEYVVDVLAEPFGGSNRQPLGFDLLSDSTRQRALERARDTGTVSLSGSVHLARDRGSASRPALLMFVPVYRRDTTPTSVEDRRRALIGYVSAAFHIDELVAGSVSHRALPLAVAIREGEPATPGALLYANAVGQQMLADPRQPLLTVDIPLSLSGHTWTLRFGASRNASVGLQGTDPSMALGAGISVSLFLFAIAWSESTLRARATKLANEMTQAVREQAQLLDLTHDTVFLRDRTNIIRYWNRAASDTYGFSAAEAIGRTADDLLKTRFPIPLATLWDELTRNDRWEGELVHTRRDGSDILVTSRWAVQRGANGEIEAILETNNDVTERRRAEEDRRRLEASLLQAQKLEAMGTLAGGVAHDFNNILGAILGYGELARNAAPAASSLRRYVDNMMSAGLRAKSLVDRILVFSRSGVGPRVPVHVQSVVVEALELLNASLPDNIRLQPTLAADDAAVFGDPTQIHQVVLNLCTNAVQAMRSGGTLSVCLDLLIIDAPRTVITSTLAAGPYLRLCVHDTGVGIEPALRDRVFDPFFTTKGVGVGTGLGLSLVHGIVTDLGGGVDMTSEVSQGTTFEVYLPRHGRADPQTAYEDAVTRGAGETIMLVDDEEMLVRLGEEMIAGLGYEAVGFTSAAQALEAFRADPHRFAAVLSDETMPGMTGSQLTEQIIAIRADTPIVLMSGYAGTTLAARARSAGARDVIGKPLALRDIATVLANLTATKG